MTSTDENQPPVMDQQYDGLMEIMTSETEQVLLEFVLIKKI